MKNNKSATSETKSTQSNYGPPPVSSKYLIPNAIFFPLDHIKQKTHFTLTTSASATLNTALIWASQVTLNYLSTSTSTTSSAKQTSVSLSRSPSNLVRAFEVTLDRSSNTLQRLGRHHMLLKLLHLKASSATSPGAFLAAAT